MVCTPLQPRTLLCFATHFTAGTKSNPKRNLSAKPKKTVARKSKLKLENPLHFSLAPSDGGNATTYTSLPPKDDFCLPVLQSSPREVKLSESSLIKAPKTDKKAAKRSDFEDEFDEDYEKYDLYEVGSDSEYETDDDFEDSYDGVDEIVDSGATGNESDGEFEENDVIELEALREKEKGVPAVMRCFDRAKIFVKAGDGGNGVVAMRREKFVPLGGPSGGDGGRGGNIYVEVDRSMNSLLPFRNGIHFRAGSGTHGQGREKHGAKGQDVVVKVPPGTVIRKADEEGEGVGDVLLELLHPGQRALLLPGGRGGRGNASFKTGTNRVPRIAENGEEGIEMWLELELKLVADVGIVGAPNAGKSTLLSVVSAARPEIANYPFTTLLPNLGVVAFDYDSTMIVADLPGLLEGAHRGFGLGHEFLRHTERCSVLVHVVDGSSQQAEYEFDAVRLELEMFSPELSEKDYIVAYNKMDLPEARENWNSFKDKLSARGIEVFSMSAVVGEGTHEVISAAFQRVQKMKDDSEEEVITTVNVSYVDDMVQKQRTAPISEFEISHDSSTNTWHVVGVGLQRFVQKTNWRYVDSMRRFQHVLEACGVNKSLLKLGVKDGDTVVVGEVEMVWQDAVDNAGPTSKTKWGLGSVK